MPSLLVIRLIPEKAISATDFETYLTNLKIEASDASFTNPNGTAAPFGSATYIAPGPVGVPHPNPFPPEDPNTRIVQHFEASLFGPGFIIDFKSVATAVIVIPTPPANGEFQTADIFLKITRG